MGPEAAQIVAPTPRGLGPRKVGLGLGQPTYDALLIRYYHRLLCDISKHLGKDQEPVLTPEVADQREPLPTPTASINELDQLSSNIAE